MAQAEAGTARSSNTKGLFMEITRYRWSVDLALHLADIGAKKKGCQRGATGQPLSTALPLVLKDGSKGEMRESAGSSCRRASHLEGIDIPGLTNFKPGAAKSAGRGTPAIARTIANVEPAIISPNTASRSSGFMQNKKADCCV